MRMTNHIDAEIGQRLRQARLVENLTQEGLAEKLGISFQQIQKYENGTNRVSASRLWAIAGVLRLPITYFYDGQNETHPSEKPEQNTHLPDNAIRVARLLNDMPEGDIKDRVFGLVKACARVGGV